MSDREGEKHPIIRRVDVLLDEGKLSQPLYKQKSVLMDLSDAWLLSTMEWSSSTRKEAPSLLDTTTEPNWGAMMEMFISSSESTSLTCKQSPADAITLLSLMRKEVSGHGETISLADWVG